MSIWDDSWGACDARGVRGDRGMLRRHEEGPDACDARPLEHTPIRVSGRSGPMPTIVPHEDDGNRRDLIVTEPADTDVCPVCGWMRWEHRIRPERCGLMA